MEKREPVLMYQPWSCDACQVAGSTQHLSDCDAAAVMQQAQREHEPCAGRLRFGARRLAPPPIDEGRNLTG